MKTRIGLTIILLLLSSNAFAEINSPPDLERYCQGSPGKLSRWINGNIWYRSDKDKWGVSDYWQTPEETLSRNNKYGQRSGDCEDYAVLAYRVLSGMGYDPHLFTIIFSVNGKILSHATTAFEWNGTYYYMGVEHLTNSGEKNLDNLFKYFNGHRVVHKREISTKELRERLHSPIQGE